MGFYKNDATAANNAALNGINAQGGASPQNIDNLIRELAAQGKQFALDIGGATTVGGTADAITISANDTVADAYFDGMVIGFVAGSDNATTTPTANVNSIGAEPIKKALSTSGSETALAAGDIQSGGLYLLRWRSAWDSGGGAWQLIDLQHSLLHREVLSANLNLYVNGSTGSDSNDGLSSGAAFATLQKAINTTAALDIGTYNVTINVADATYTAGISVTAPWIGSGTVSVVGNTTTPANCTISTTSASCIDLSNGARLTVSGFKLQTTTGGQCLQATNNAALTVNGAIEIGAAPVYHVYAANGGTININTNYTLSGGSIYHWVALSGGRINWVNYTMTISGTPAFSGAFAYASRLGAISCHLGTFSGSATGTRYVVDSNSVIFTNGAGATYLPGNASGSASTGGQYI